MVTKAHVYKQHVHYHDINYFIKLTFERDPNRLKSACQISRTKVISSKVIVGDRHMSECCICATKTFGNKRTTNELQLYGVEHFSAL